MTESQGQAVVTAPVSAKQNSGSIPATQPYNNRLSGYIPKPIDVSINFYFKILINVKIFYFL